MRNFLLLAGVSIFWAIYAPSGLAQTNIWNGPTTNFVHPNMSSTADTIVAGKVVLNRGINEVLFNTAAGETAASAASPKDVGFAFVNGRDITTAPSFSYQSMFSLRNGSLAGVILNKPMVIKLTNENIYIPVMFTTWNSGFQGGFAYTRGIGPAAVAPTVSITSPSAGATFGASANIPLTANATVSGGTVTNVQYFAGATSLGHATTTPFSVTGNIAAAGPYSLTAVATAGGISATSTTVNITVINPPTVSITTPASGAVFAAPANVKLAANASVTGSTVTNVSYFNNTTLLGSAQSSPFNFTAPNLSAGPYSFTAVATASGVSGTSSVVNISVVTPVATSLAAPKISNGIFSFDYGANPGLSYVVERSSNLSTWLPIITNMAAANPVTYSEGFNSNGSSFYRVGRLPNP